MEIEMKGNQLATRIHRKTTHKGLLLHYQSHVENKYKHSLLKTMLIRTHHLSCSPDPFANECNNLRSMFLKLKYPPKLIKSTINSFIHSQDQAEPQHQILLDQPIRICLPVERSEAGWCCTKRFLQPTHQENWKRHKGVEAKPPLINQHWVVYKFSCDLCDTGYVRYTSQHLFQCITENKHFSIGQHLKEEHMQPATN